MVREVRPVTKYINVTGISDRFIALSHNDTNKLTNGGSGRLERLKLLFLSRECDSFEHGDKAQSVSFLCANIFTG